jgi:NAD(P)-dependent dehydrogenase (short-subunit alcohol dehydrogenase family)
MSGELEGKVAIITGGASGIGLGTAELFLEEGAKVVIADVNDSLGNKVSKELGSSARFRKTDVSAAADVQALVDFAVAEFGALHIMYNNAGISDDAFGRFLDADLGNFHRVMGVNLLGVMHGTQIAGRYMATHGGGSIINTSSTAGLLPGFGVAIYRASKVGVEHFTKCAAIELGEFNIRVNSVAPAHTETPMTNYSEPGLAPDVLERVKGAVIEASQRYYPIKRTNLPHDIAQATLFLASDRSRNVTGIVIPVASGATAGDLVNHAQNIMRARDTAVARR